MPRRLFISTACPPSGRQAGIAFTWHSAEISLPLMGGDRYGRTCCCGDEPRQYYVAEPANGCAYRLKPIEILQHRETPFKGISFMPVAVSYSSGRRRRKIRPYGKRAAPMQAEMAPALGSNNTAMPLLSVNPPGVTPAHHEMSRAISGSNRLQNMSRVCIVTSRAGGNDDALRGGAADRRKRELPPRVRRPRRRRRGSAKKTDAQTARAPRRGRASRRSSSFAVSCSAHAAIRRSSINTAGACRSAGASAAPFIGVMLAG